MILDETLPEVKAHDYCLENFNDIKNDKKCGCFYCLEIFPASKIDDWIVDKNGLSAVCPYCDIDSVIGESSGYPITKEFLKKMHKVWFDLCIPELK